MAHIFFDTTVLVASFIQNHPQHAQALPAVRRAAIGDDQGYISAHSFAEVYAVLTRLPVRPPIHPVEAARIVTENIVAHCEAVALLKEE
jgi:predicted nucleic acid-binding protein